jgi:hypothetical protein
LKVDVDAATAAQIENYEDNVDVVPEGYTLYVVSISQEGLGAFTNSNSATSTAQKKKPVGFLPVAMTFKWTFDSTNFDKIYPDADYLYVEGNQFAFASSYSDTAMSISAYVPTITNGTDIYPLNASGVSSIAENETIADIYILVDGEATGSLDATTLFNMAQMSGGSNQAISGSNVTSNMAKYAISNGTLSGPPTLTLAPKAATTWDITFDVDGVETVLTFDDGDAISADGVSTTKAGYNFVGWSETDGGAVVGSLGTASADKTFYAVFEVADTATYTAVGQDNSGSEGVTTIAPGSYQTVGGDSVYLSDTYKAAKFENVDFNTALKKYRVVLFDGTTKAQMPWINFGSDIEVDTARIVVVVKELGTHTVTAIKIEEDDK